jgi:hypothetical protein
MALDAPIRLASKRHQDIGFFVAGQGHHQIDVADIFFLQEPLIGSVPVQDNGSCPAGRPEVALTWIVFRSPYRQWIFLQAVWPDDTRFVHHRQSEPVLRGWPALLKMAKVVEEVFRFADEIDQIPGP